MVTDQISFQMEINILANIGSEIQMDLDNINGQMEILIQGYFKMD
jgi:hypothetical protein